MGGAEEQDLTQTITEVSSDDFDRFGAIRDTARKNMSKPLIKNFPVITQNSDGSSFLLFECSSAIQPLSLC